MAISSSNVRSLLAARSAARPPHSPAARRVAVAAMVGTAIEWYDFFVYGTSAVLVIGPLFFGTDDPLTGTLLAFSTFGVGILARPAGAVVLAHIGDRHGRKPALVLSLVLQTPDAGWECRRGLKVFDRHEDALSALDHMRRVIREHAPAELFLHRLDGTITSAGLARTPWGEEA